MPPTLREDLLAKKHFGVCKLTRDYDKFVEAHLLPKALTRPVSPGTPWIQGGNRTKPVRAWSSWTDTRLVTRRGENILRDLDTWAIAKLRSEQLVWSGWEEDALRGDLHERMGGTEFGFRTIKGLDWRKMRLFFLSLLWRAGASANYAMNDVAIESEELEALRQAILNNDPEPIGFFPIMLVQLSTRGPVHNHGPIAVRKNVPSTSPEGADEEVNIFRFYLDGLVIHFERRHLDSARAQAMGKVLLGSTDELGLLTIEYEDSFQDKNLRRMQQETEAAYSNILEKLAWPPIR